MLRVLVASSCLLASASADAAGSVRVGTFNIRYANDADGENAWRHRRATVCGILGDGDFWGLQEALPSQVDEIRAARPEYGVVARTREADPAKGEACPILYRSDRWTLDPADHGTFWLSETPEVAGSRSWDSSLPRIATYARFTAKEGGRGIYVFNAHLDHKGEQARLESAELLARRIAARRHAGDPVILLGDFNCGPASEPVRALLGDGALALRDAWRETNPAAPEQPTFNGWADACSGERIDFILAAGALDTESASIDAAKRDGRWPSDHAFVRAEFVWRP
jgi:endonuclease/exonuclease/phosphatase family metal-dependent hydrolase